MIIERKITLTRKLILAGSSNGTPSGLKLEQIRLLGITKRKGWLNRLIGLDVNQTTYDLFLKLRFTGNKKYKKRLPLNKRKKNKENKYKYVYNHLLSNPLWKSKRDEILDRDNYACIQCGFTYNLVVHHMYYYKKKTDPWCYPNDALVTLCGNCHAKWHAENKNVYKDYPVN